ncbi:HAD-IIB family hydrolase [Marinomonas sp. 15G1-11]|uniref:HAD-IIB family hydrolase n=1 Tax=Marinomonas phaeophyticola TaxID=3004091 RepID=A0ABT4JQM5_9GAMM|nr:HAD-IIB family hydrolase [Marinomonas sp. 15G1-11]MCZ2720665.1 HAD-IIB family hydrolase [Marinomonas sp. 15G1-11]
MNCSFIVFTDLDGTLLDHHTYSFNAAIPALAKLKNKKIPIIPNTSKTFDELLPILQQLQLNSPFIVENGAAVYIPESFLLDLCSSKVDLLERYTAENKITKVILGSSAKGCYYRKAFIESRQYWLSLLEDQGAEFSHLHTGFSKMSVAEIQSITGLNLEQAQAASKREFGEPLQWHGSEAELNQFTQQMKRVGASVVKGGRFVHVGGNSDKGRAMKWLTSFLKSNTSVALGDGENDSSMLEVADIAVQIRSESHSFPVLNRTSGVIQTTAVGPMGWNEAIDQILFSEGKATGSKRDAF